MSKIATILCITLFIAMMGGSVEGNNRERVIEAIDDVKQQIGQKPREIHQRAFLFGEKANDDLINYARMVNRGIQEATERVQNEINELLKDSSNTIKEQCNVYATTLDNNAKIVQENVADCVQPTIMAGAQHLPAAFRLAGEGQKNLNEQEKRAASCSDDECNQILNEVYSIGNKTIKNIEVEYEAYVDTIGNNNYLIGCINEVETGYQAFFNELPIFVANTKQCIASKLEKE